MVLCVASNYNMVPGTFIYLQDFCETTSFGQKGGEYMKNGKSAVVGVTAIGTILVTIFALGNLVAIGLAEDATPGGPPYVPPANVTLPNITMPNITLPHNLTLPKITLPNITLPNVTRPNVTAPANGSNPRNRTGNPN